MHFSGKRASSEFACTAWCSCAFHPAVSLHTQQHHALSIVPWIMWQAVQCVFLTTNKSATIYKAA